MSKYGLYIETGLSIVIPTLWKFNFDITQIITK